MLKVDRISEKVPGIVMEFISEKAYAPCINLYSGRIKCSQLFFMFRVTIKLVQYNSITKLSFLFVVDHLRAS